MSQFNLFNWFGPRAPVIATAAPKPDKTPDATPSTAAQTTYGNGYLATGGGFSGLPVSINGAVLGFQGGSTPWVQPPRYWPGTYRLMRLHPTLAITRGAVLDPIRANEWTIQGKVKDKGDGKGTPKEWIDFVSEVVLRQRTAVINHALTAPEFGFAPFEKRWSVVDGDRVCDLFPLRMDWTTLYTTPQGEYAGLTNLPWSGGVAMAYDPNQLIGPQYSLVVSHDMDAGNLCGQSRYEAAYDAWCDWQWTRLDMARLRGKLSSIIPMLKFPAGTTELGVAPNIKEVDNATIAQRILDNIGNGRGVAIPSVEFSTSAIQENPKLANTTLWELTFYDAGSYAPAQAGMIENEKYQDTLMAYAWKVRPQQIFDAQNGTKAQAGTHTDSASVDPEQLESEICEQLNRQWVDDLLLYKFGPKAVGQVFIRPQPLSNPTVAFKQSVVTSLLSGNDPEAISNLDTKALMEDSELPVLNTPKAIPEPEPKPDGREPEKVQGLSAVDALSRLEQFCMGETIELSATGEPHKFASTQINIPEPHTKSIMDFIRSIPDDEIDPKDGRETCPHVTAKYGLHDDAPDSVREIVSGTKAPVLTLGKLSIFPASADRPSDVLKAEVHSVDLHRLNKRIAKLPHTDTHPKYIPHMTLAYLKPGEGEKYVGHDAFEGLKCQPKSLCFNAKDGTVTDLPFADEDGAVLNLSAAADLTDGEWRTINGAHVYMKDGVAAAGPKGVVDKINGRDKERSTPSHLIGKTHAEIESHGKTTDKAREGFHRIDRDANGNYVGTRDKSGKVERVQEHAERVKAAKFAPGYKAAHLAEDPHAELQAIAIDSKDRPQYKYSDAHNEEAKAGKFARGREFNRKLEEIRQRLKADARAGGKGSEEAHALRLIDETGFRVGGEADTGAEKQAYGATTLESRHVKSENGKTKVEFVGKKGVDNSHEIHDPEIAGDLNKRAKSGGKLYNTNDAKVRDYLHSVAPGFKVKDFRTAVAFRTASREIEGMPVPKTVKDFVAARGKVAEVVSRKLGNTPAVALKDYIDPTVFNKWSGTVANSEQAGLIAEHAKATGLKGNDAARDWVTKNAKKYREDFNKRISKNAASKTNAA